MDPGSSNRVHLGFPGDSEQSNGRTDLRDGSERVPSGLGCAVPSARSTRVALPAVDDNLSRICFHSSLSRKDIFLEFYQLS